MLKTSLVLAALFVALSSLSWAASLAELNDLGMAHAAYTADVIDIRYAHLALVISTNLQVWAFAETMIRDHTAVNDRALALLQKLNVQPHDNFLSQQLVTQSDTLVEEIRQLSGRVFDKRYASNELSYHQSVNMMVEKTFLPNLQHPEVKALCEDALVIFKAHEQHAHHMINALQH